MSDKNNNRNKAGKREIDKNEIETKNGVQNEKANKIRNEPSLSSREDLRSRNGVKSKVTAVRRDNKGAVITKNIVTIGITAAAVCLFAMIMTYMMPSKRNESGFDDNVWREAVSQAETEFADSQDNIVGSAQASADTLPVTSDTLNDLSGNYLKDNIENDSEYESAFESEKSADKKTTSAASEDVIFVNTAEKLIMQPPVDGEITFEYSGDELVFSKTMRDWRTHNGVDFAASEGTDVKAAADGAVEAITDSGMNGRTITILHDNGVRSIYANLAEGSEVSAGDNVLCGTVIGKVGNTAVSEVAEVSHLHFEVSVNEETVNPFDYLSTSEASAWEN